MKRCLKMRILPLVCVIVLLIGALMVPIFAEDAVPSGAFSSCSYYINVCTFDGKCYAYGYFTPTVSNGVVSFQQLYPSLLSFLLDRNVSVDSVDYVKFVLSWSSRDAFDYYNNPLFVLGDVTFLSGSLRTVEDVGFALNMSDLGCGYNRIQIADFGGFTPAAVHTVNLTFDGPLSSFSNFCITSPSEIYLNGHGCGYSLGKQDGIKISEDGTFTNLISAVVDAPVKAVTGFLDFEILGQNMLSFLGALMSLCLIVFILKRVI